MVMAQGREAREAIERQTAALERIAVVLETLIAVHKLPQP
jgi:hypothetical protein